MEDIYEGLTENASTTQYNFVFACFVAEKAISDSKANAPRNAEDIIIANVFTAFMVEGVINYLGEILNSNWKVRPGKKEKRIWERSTLNEKLETVREQIGVVGESDFNPPGTIERFKVARDFFAHPKKIEMNGNPRLPMVYADLEQGFKEIKEYLQKIAQKTYEELVSEQEENIVLFSRKHPHIGSIPNNLRSVLGISSTSSGWPKG